MYREIIAFVVAALAVPILVAIDSYPGTSKDSGYALFLSVVTVVAFIAVPILGVPAYRFLKAKRWTAFWIAPLTGFIVATVVWYVVMFLFGLTIVPNKSYVWSRLINVDSLRAALWPVGPIGAAVGVILWLIARPDRTSD